jgi:pimeloyl-ACP methyl ester carboxylesterase
MTTSETANPPGPRTRPPRRTRSRTLRWGALATGIALAAALAPTSIASATSDAPARHSSTKPTVVLVHGAWADGSTWSGEVRRLQARGYTVNVAPNPLRGLAEDSAYLKAYLASITGPIVLVGHSYGGAVITDAATGNANVKALVYDDAYIPDVGENIATLSGPDSALAAAATNPTSVFTLVPYPGAPSGIYDTYLLPKIFISALAGDLPRARAAVLAASQSATSLLALGEPSSAPAWKTIPSWDVVGRQDKVIPLAQQLSMAARAGSHVTRIDSAHLSLISHPGKVTAVIMAAANATIK